MEDTAGWKSVEVGDGLLIGSAEGGFSGLEELSSNQGEVIEACAAQETLSQPSSKPGLLRKTQAASKTGIPTIITFHRTA